MKKYLYYGIAAAILIIAAVMFFKFRNYQPAVNTAASVINPPHQYNDDGGTVHTEIPVEQVDIAGINKFYQQYYDEYYSHIVDSLTKLLHSKASNVSTIIEAGTQTEETFIPNLDTAYDDANVMQPVEINYKDKWLQLHGWLTDDSSWSYKAKDSLIFVVYAKKSGFLNLRSTLYMDAFSMNPHTQINGLRGINLNSSPFKKWGLGFSGGYMFNGQKFGPYIGIGINYNIIHF